MSRPRVRVAFEGTVVSWFTLLFALGALALQENLVFLLGCIAFSTSQGARLLARRNLRGVAVERSLPGRARAGVPVAATYRVRSPQRRPVVGVVVEDRHGTGVRPVSLLLDFAGIPAGESQTRTTRLVFGRRGRHKLRSVRVSSRYPLGFYRAEAGLPLENTLLVRPREGRPSPLFRSWMGGSTRAAVRPSLLAHGDDALHGVREFRDGDDPRRIHWRTTARRGALTMTEWRREEGREAVILLGRAHGAGGESLRAFERAVSATATLWRAAHRHGIEAQLDLGIQGERPMRSRRHLGAGLDRLAVVKPQGGRRPRASLRRHVGRSGSRLLIYVATGPEKGVQARLSRAAGRGGRWLLLRADRPDLSRWVKGLR